MVILSNASLDSNFDDDSLYDTSLNSYDADEEENDDGLYLKSRAYTP
jgi:hypothetical protein